MEKQKLKDAFYSGKMYGIAEQGSRFPCFDDWYKEYTEKELCSCKMKQLCEDELQARCSVYLVEKQYKDMKKYKLKGDCKKYFTSPPLTPKTEQEWKDKGISIIALEEVENNVELAKRGAGEQSLMKVNNTKWTTREARDIKKFLNVFGSWDMMHSKVTEHMIGFEINAFDEWLDKKGS